MLYNRTLTGYLPPIFAAAPELRALLDVCEQPEVEALWAEQERLPDEGFAATASGTSIARWERMMGLPGSGDLETRRAAVAARLREQPPFTERSLRAALDGLYGEGEYELKIEGFSLTLLVPPGEDPAGPEGFLRRVLPANLALTLGNRLMTHRRLAAYRHSAIAARTHEGVRNANRI
jgi:hypothetical protein